MLPSRCVSSSSSVCSWLQHGTIRHSIYGYMCTFSLRGSEPQAGLLRTIVTAVLGSTYQTAVHIWWKGSNSMRCSRDNCMTAFFGRIWPFS
jgi:hypothetical protein